MHEGGSFQPLELEAVDAKVGTYRGWRIEELLQANQVLKITASEGKCLGFILSPCQLGGNGKGRDLSSVVFGIFTKATRKKNSVCVSGMGDQIRF